MVKRVRLELPDIELPEMALVHLELAEMGLLPDLELAQMALVHMALGEMALMHLDLLQMIFQCRTFCCAKLMTYPTFFL